MARTMRRCLIAQLQPDLTEEPKINPSVPRQEEQADAIKGKGIADYKLNIYMNQRD